jgi:hypothetical protein
VFCGEDSSCVMLCRDSLACAFATCSGQIKDCGNGVIVCNAACPSATPVE